MPIQATPAQGASTSMAAPAQPTDPLRLCVSAVNPGALTSLRRKQRFQGLEETVLHPVGRGHVVPGNSHSFTAAGSKLFHGLQPPPCFFPRYPFTPVQLLPGSVDLLGNDVAVFLDPGLLGIQDFQAREITSSALW